MVGDGLVGRSAASSDIIGSGLMTVPATVVDVLVGTVVEEVVKDVDVDEGGAVVVLRSALVVTEAAGSSRPDVQEASRMAMLRRSAADPRRGRVRLHRSIRIAHSMPPALGAAQSAWSLWLGLASSSLWPGTGPTRLSRAARVLEGWPLG